MYRLNLKLFLKGVFAKNEMGHWLTTKINRF